MGTKRFTADMKIIPRIIHIILEDPKKESKGKTRPLGESVGQLVRPLINEPIPDDHGGGRGAAGGEFLRERQIERETRLSLSLTDRQPRSIDDQSTIDRCTDHLDRSRRQPFSD